MAGITRPVNTPNHYADTKFLRTADVPVAPVLTQISPNPDYDTRVYLSWGAVTGATSYKVYRNETQITSVTGLTPIGTCSITNYNDTSISTSGLYWYAVVAANASGDGPVSNSENISVVLNDPSIVFYDDLGASTLGNTPAGWSAFQDIPNVCFYMVMTEGAYAATNRIIYMTDNQAGERIYGNTTFSRAVTSGNFSFSFKVNMIGGGGNDPRHYDVILQDANYNPVITARMTNNVAAGNNYWSLQGTAGTTLYPYSVYYKISVAFAGGKANLSVNGVVESALTNVVYSGGAIKGLRIAPVGTETGGDYMFEAPFIMRETATLPELVAPVLNQISPNPDYDTRVYLSWGAVAGAMSYKVYRNATQITSVTGLTPIGTCSITNYNDTSISTSGLYWYAVVATNASDDGPVSNSENISVVLNDPSIFFYDDLGASTPGNTPAGWSAFQDIPNTCFYMVMTEGAYGATNRIIYMTDNQAGVRIYGNTSFSRAITSGNFSFRFMTDMIGTGDDPRHYDVILQDANYNAVITARMTHNAAAGNNYWSLQGTAGTTLYPYQAYYQISVAFAGGKANLSVNGVVESALTNVVYSGGAIKGLRIAPVGTETGGEYIFEAPFIMRETATLPVPAAPVLTPISPNPNYDTRVYLSWGAVAGATSYKVYRDAAEITTVLGLTPVNTITETNYVDSVSSSGLYWYAIVATNTSGDSLPSNSVNVTVIIPRNNTVFSIDIGIHVIIVRGPDGNNLFELSINVQVTLQMSVTVSTGNPSTIGLSDAITYFKIDTLGGTYSQVVAKFYYNSSNVKTGEEDRLDIHYLGDNGWARQYGQIYKDSHYILLNLAHFSTYAVAIVPEPTQDENPYLLYIILAVVAIGAILGIAAILKMWKRNKKTKMSENVPTLEWDWDE